MAKFGPEQAEALVDEWLAAREKRWGFYSRPQESESRPPNSSRSDSSNSFSSPAERKVFYIERDGTIRPYYGSARQESAQISGSNFSPTGKGRSG